MNRIYKRTTYMKTVEVDEILEKDLIQNNWDLFEIKRPIGFGTIQVKDIQRPDTLSQRIYNTPSYWWILCKVNHIDDLWNDLYVGMDFIIPSIEDINDFFRNINRRMRS